MGEIIEHVKEVVRNSEQAGDGEEAAYGIEAADRS